VLQLWYADEMPLHIAETPEQSQRGSQHGDPLGRVVLTVQPVHERVDAACDEAPFVAYLDDMNIIGKVTPAAGACGRLCVDDDGVRSIGLEPRLPKCSGDKQQVAAEAAKLRIAHQLDGFTAVSTALESAE